MFLRLVLLLPVCFFTTYSLSAQKKVQWANEVIDASSFFRNAQKAYSRQFRPNQVLGKPNKFPVLGQSPCAWAPSYKDREREEWIHVGFKEALSIKQVAIFENFNPGAITRVYAYGEAKQDSLIYENRKPQPLQEPGRILAIHSELPFLVKELKIYLNTQAVPGFNQIDAIALSNSLDTIQARINLLEKGLVIGTRIKLSNQVNSSYNEIAPVLSPEGDKIYFTRSGHPDNLGILDKQDVWYAEKKANGTFGKARNLGEPINNEVHNSIFSISSDGNRILLNNIYQKNGKTIKGLSQSQRIKREEWTWPEEVIIKDYYNLHRFSEFSYAPDGQVLLMTVEREDSQGGKDIYFSRLQSDGTWSKPTNIGPVVNTAANETSPRLSQDGRFLFFATAGLSGYGSADIFISQRLDESWTNWSSPKNLGPEINSKYWDAYLFLPQKSNDAYFCSYGQSKGPSDIYKIRLNLEVLSR